MLHHRPSIPFLPAVVALTVLAAVAPPGHAAARPLEETVRQPLPSPEEIARLPPDGGAEFNRLIHETSPYLLQHARNPVDWYPWGDEAFRAAREQQKPIFLSIGYSTCHWCHVMEHECFEAETVAAVLNERFIAIKVDREERPDVDEIYMTATQIVTSRGGWPNSVFLTPRGKPFYAGTYFPRQTFLQILDRVSDLWNSDRARIEEDANRLSEAIHRHTQLPGEMAGDEPLDRAVVDGAVAELRRSFDAGNGGFGSAPKFPPHGSLAILLHEFKRTGDESLEPLIRRTLDGMAAGGMHDHIGGGFHRYATDARWFLPHFEKMLYDNAQLAAIYAEAGALFGNEHWKDVARRALDWVLRDMTNERGGFYSALDADSEGEEGKFYLWTPSQVADVLGEEEGAFFCRVYDITAEGTYHEEATGQRMGTSIPVLYASFDSLARAVKAKPEDLARRLARDRQALRERRDTRVWPLLDDKAIAAWNGLMIGSLARSGALLEEKDYLRAAERAASFVLDEMRGPDGRLFHTWRAGETKIPGYLDDYAFLADALLGLYDVTGDDRWRNSAVALTRTAREDFADLQDGGLWYSGRGHETLLARSKDPFDAQIPSANGMMARVLVRLGAHDPVILRQARPILDEFRGLMRNIPRGTESLVLATALYFDVAGKEAEAPATKAPAVAVDEKGEAERAEEEEAAPSGAAQRMAADVERRPDARLRSGPVTADLYASRIVIAPGQKIEVAVRIVMDAGWHINSNHPLQSYLVPTSLQLAEGSRASLREVVYPPGRELRFSYSDEPISVYDGEVWIRAQVTLPQDEGDLRFDLRVQPCDDRACLAPETISLQLPVVFDVDAARETAGAVRHPDLFP